jgi:DDE superfamily endonuclease
MLCIQPRCPPSNPLTASQQRFLVLGAFGSLFWIENHPRFVFHFTPTSASWLNAVESFFAKLTKRRLKRGVFRSLQELKDAVHRFLGDTNANPNPFYLDQGP